MNIQHRRKFDATFTLGNILGSGAFSDVVEAKHRHCSATYAVKVIHKCNLDEDEYRSLEEEIDILYSLNHRNILKLFSVYNETDMCYLVMELLLGGELSERLDAKNVYTEDEALQLCTYLLKAVWYCHGNNIAHRDLKPENLLLIHKNNDTQIKITDFGFSKRCPKPNSLTTQCGTLDYTAPEILAGKPYGTVVDMWSVGVIIYILLCGYEPFAIGTYTRKRQKILIGKYEFHEERWSHITYHAKNFIRCLLNVNANKRFTAKEACNHPWIVLKHNCDDRLDRTNDTVNTSGSHNTTSSWRNIFIKEDKKLGAIFRNTVQKIRSGRVTQTHA